MFLKDDFLKECPNNAFLALVIWREARGEDIKTKIGVGFSIMNRVHSPKWWGNDVLSVVFKKWQYSSMTDPNDPQLVKWPLCGDASWLESLSVAYDVINKMVENPIKGADSYYDDSIPPPKWATAETFIKKLGHISFHNLDMDIEK